VPGVLLLDDGLVERPPGAVAGDGDVQHHALVELPAPGVRAGEEAVQGGGELRRVDLVR
jgi:hypothetical protein